MILLFTTLDPAYLKNCYIQIIQNVVHVDFLHKFITGTIILYMISTILSNLFNCVLLFLFAIKSCHFYVYTASTNLHCYMAY